MKFTARARKIKGFDGILKLTQQRYPLDQRAELAPIERRQMRERIYKALITKYNAQIEEALLKIDLLLERDAKWAVAVIDKLLGEVADTEAKMAKLRQFYGTN